MISICNASALATHCPARDEMTREVPTRTIPARIAGFDFEGLANGMAVFHKMIAGRLFAVRIFIDEKWSSDRIPETLIEAIEAVLQKAEREKDGTMNETKEPTPTADPMLQWFVYDHLRDDLKDTSRQFAVVAQWIAANLPRNPERTIALRKLLEAKDAAVRARIYQ